MKKKTIICDPPVVNVNKYQQIEHNYFLSIKEEEVGIEEGNIRPPGTQRKTCFPHLADAFF